MPRRHTLLLIVATALAAPALGHAADKAAQKGTFLPISDLAASAPRLSGGHGVMTVEAGLDIPDPALFDKASEDQPRLRDAFAQVLQAYAGGLPAGQLPDIDYMAARLQAATDRTLGRPGARLLLGGVMVN